jgi:3-deoxy-manno-octulosonate cytidylyltransferase (CMP-KDO synthetase)
MIERVYRIAEIAAEKSDCDFLVLTEDSRIVDFCESRDMHCMLTSDKCKTGTDRVLEAVQKLDYRPDFILNLQGDAPLTPPWFLTGMIEVFQDSKEKDMLLVTPGYRMTWAELDKMREEKKTTPFTGTSIIMDRSGSGALWFSKNIIPALREEKKLREKSEYSPVVRHIGLYGYSYQMLRMFGELEEGYYEKLEGLEQLRILENGYKIKVALVDYRGRPSSSGVDTPEDVARAEAIVEKFGEFEVE